MPMVYQKIGPVIYHPDTERYEELELQIRQQNKQVHKIESIVAVTVTLVTVIVSFLLAGIWVPARTAVNLLILTICILPFLYVPLYIISITITKKSIQNKTGRPCAKGSMPYPLMLSHQYREATILSIEREPDNSKITIHYLDRDQNAHSRAYENQFTVVEEPDSEECQIDFNQMMLRLPK